MKNKILFLTTLCTISLTIFQCSGKKDDWTVSKPEVRPNAHIIKKQLDMIRIGDKEVKATAFLGQPTIKKSTQKGTEMIWYLIPSDYREDAYETLKQVPQEPKGHKFIRFYFDNSNKITEREFEL